MECALLLGTFCADRRNYHAMQQMVIGHQMPLRIWDAQGNERHGSQTDFGWKLYIDNPLADCEPPEYVPNSMTLSLSRSD